MAEAPCPMGGSTAHHLHTVHGAGPNLGENVRRAWIVDFTVGSRTARTVEAAHLVHSGWAHELEPERDALRRAVADGPRLSAGAVAHAADFSWHRTADGLLATYRDAVADRVSLPMAVNL